MDALAKACVKCGVELRQDQKTFKWYGGKISPCDAAIVHPNPKAYQIGVHKTETGLRIEFDPFRSGYGMQNAVAFEDNLKGLGKLQQAYAVEVARKQAKKQGFSFREQVQADGRVKLTLSR
jgi:hypothetical protein